MKNLKIALITEANEQVASGHLHEMMDLEKELVTRGNIVTLFVNDDMPILWKNDLQVQHLVEYKHSIEDDIENLIYKIKTCKIDCIVTNLRQINDSTVSLFKEQIECKLICIDEWGNRELHCDVVINNMLDSSYWNYYNTPKEMHLGEKYLTLSKKIVTYHKKEKKIKPRIENIVVSMGGVDPLNHTREIVDFLKRSDLRASFHIVLGGAYKFEDDLVKTIAGDYRFILYKNIDYIYDLFFEADIAFSAGGNTLYELAAIGTPTYIYPTMEHEQKNGLVFEAKGFGKVIENVDDIGFEQFNYQSRRRHAVNGKMIVDGEGLNRIVEIILMSEE